MIKDVYKSFFRTLGRILAYIFIGFLISVIIGYLKPVKAASIKTYVNDLQYDGSTLSTSDYTYRASGNRNIFFDLVFDTEINNRWNYVSLVLCSSSGYSGGYVPDGYKNYIKNISYNETNFSCPYANSSYDGGKVVIINFMLFNGDGEFSGYFTTYQNGSASVQLIDFVINDNQFVSAQNYSSYDLIIKNSQIINQNNTIINQGKQTNDKLDDLNGKQDQTNQKLDDLNDSLNNDDVSGSSSTADSFFKNFNSGDDKGLQDIVTLPLKYIKNLSAPCKAFTLPLAQLGEVQVHCMSSSVYNNTDLKPLFDILKILVNGFICYKCLKSLFEFIQDLRNPDNDKVEVMDL